MDMILAEIVVMVLQVYTNFKMHQVVYIKYIQLVACQ